MDRKGDKHLAKRLMSGDKKALRKFYGEFKPRLKAYVKQRVGDGRDVEEIVQDSFLGFLDALPLFSFRSSLYTFLVSIARHEVADYYRKRYAKKAIKYVPFVEQVYKEPVYDVHETREFFDKAIRRIKPLERKLLLWKYEDGLSVKEIAEKTEMSEKAVESRLFRARQSFQLAYLEIRD